VTCTYYTLVPRGTWCVLAGAGAGGGRLICRGLRKIGEGGLLYWGTLSCVKQGSDMGAYFHRGLTSGEHGWAFLYWGLLIKGILLGLLEICKMPRRRVSLAVGAPLGNLEGVRLLGLLRENK